MWHDDNDETYDLTPHTPYARMKCISGSLKTDNEYDSENYTTAHRNEINVHLCFCSRNTFADLSLVFPFFDIFERIEYLY